METIKAKVEKKDSKVWLEIKMEQEVISIPMSEDEPKAVKSAFNKVIARIKAGLFQIELEEVGEDLFSQVANEYVSQLNREIEEIYGEIKRYGLVQDR